MRDLHAYLELFSQSLVDIILKTIGIDSQNAVDLR